MCGIAGFVNLDGAPADAGVLRAMTDQIRHRGPDDHGTRCVSLRGGIPDTALGFAISKLCFEGPDDALKRTENTQPALLTVSVAAHAVLRGKGIAADFLRRHLQPAKGDPGFANDLPMGQLNKSLNLVWIANASSSSNSNNVGGCCCCWLV